jgi:kynureninase
MLLGSFPAMGAETDPSALDRADALARFRDRFALPPGVIYLDGNSLGALPKATPARVEAVIRGEWGEGLIRSWTRHGWIDLPLRLGDKIARLIGAAPGEVAVGDSTSVNLFKLLAGALALRPGRRVILSERDNFPTDLYIAEGLAALLGRGHELRLVDGAEVEAAIGADTALVLLTHVNYRSGRMHDMAALTRRAHEAGALMLWDLAHSVGAMPVDLGGCDADLAVGCGYKYLNGGPGAPAFLYIAKRLQAGFRSPLTGWLGHAAPFAFETGYRAAEGIARALTGTPAILAMAALEVGVDLMLEADMALLRAKSVALGELFRARVERDCPELTLASPRDPAARGSQICFAHPEGYAVMQALIACGVIGDFRAPDIMRFGFAPLYLRYEEVARAADMLRDILATRAWDRPEFKARAAVT